MNLLLRLFCALLVLSPISLSKSTDRDHYEIARGEDVEPAEFPFVVLVWQWSNREEGSGYVCTGTLLDAAWVLTAAHCLTDEDGNLENVEDFQIYTGHEWDNFIAKSQARQLVVHPRFTHLRPGTNDIALIQLETPLRPGRGSGIVKVLDSREESRYAPSGGTATAVGWGKTEEDEAPDIMQKVEVPHYSLQECRDRVRRFRLTFADGTVCAGTAAEGARPGDSGGPLLVRAGDEWGQIGVASRASADPEIVGFPATYVRTSLHHDWIYGHVTASEEGDPGGNDGSGSGNGGPDGALTSTEWVIPTSANTPGRFGGVFKTAAILWNFDRENDVDVTARLYGTSGLIKQETITLSSATYHQWDNFLEAVFGYRGAGAIELSADKPFNVARMEVYIDTDEGRKTTVVSARPFPMQPYSRNAMSLGVTVNANYRTNIGVFNSSSQRQTVTANLWSGQGEDEPLQVVEFALPAKGWSQKSVTASVEEGYLFWTIPREAYLYVVGVDNESQDGTLTYPIPLE